MKLVSVVKHGTERLGLLLGDVVIDRLLAAGNPAVFADTLTFIKSGMAGRKAAQAILAAPPKSATANLADVVLAAPLRPSTILCSARNSRGYNADKANRPISGKEP